MNYEYRTISVYEVEVANTIIAMDKENWTLVSSRSTVYKVMAVGVGITYEYPKVELIFKRQKEG